MFSRRSVLALGGAAALTAAAGCQRNSTIRPRLAVTMDDFALPEFERLPVIARNDAILDAFDKFAIKAAGFVTGSFVDNPQGLGVVQSWTDRGHLLGNHTYSHMHASDAAPQDYIDDIARNHDFMSQFSGYEKIFRFPYLDEGGQEPNGSTQKRDIYRKYLSDNGFQNGAVTISPSDWYVTQRMEARLGEDMKADLSAYRDFYLEHSLAIATYTQSIATDLGMAGIPHTLLVHHNILNGLFMGDLLQMFVDEGWELVDAQTAFAHPVFNARPFAVNSGRSLIRVMEQEATEYGDSTPRPHPYAKVSLEDTMVERGL